MVYRNFDRLLFAASEGTPGTAATITTSTDFFEVIEPQYTVTPLMFERPLKSQSFTKQVQTVPGTGKGGATNPVATVEFSFGMELAGPGSAVTSGTAPKMGTLFKACGLSEIPSYYYAVTGTTYSGGPFYHLEGIEGSAGAYSTPDAKSLGCNAYGDTELWAFQASSLGATTIKSQHSGATATATGLSATQFGVAYVPNTAATDQQANTTVTMRLYLGGTYVEAVGCKGTFEIAFTHGDRAVINFTFQGYLNSVTDAANPSNHIYTAEVPPAWINTGLGVGDDTGTTALWSGSLFNSMTFTLGNEMTVRENTNAIKGFQHAIITDRNPQLTWNPDAVVASGNYDIWDTFLAGQPMRMRWSLGTAVGNRVDFRVTSAQFTGVADTDRDTVTVYDTTTQLTGGSFGSSLITAAGDPSSSKMGTDNEFVIMFR